MHERVQQGLAHGDLRVVPCINPQKLPKCRMCLIVEINIVVDIIELLHQRAGKLPAILKYILIDSFKHGRLDCVETLLRQEQP